MNLEQSNDKIMKFKISNYVLQLKRKNSANFIHDIKSFFCYILFVEMLHNQLSMLG